MSDEKVMEGQETPEAARSLFQSCFHFISAPMGYALVTAAPSKDSLNDYLTHLGYSAATCRAARDGYRLLQMLGRKEFDLWVLDPEQRPAYYQFQFEGTTTDGMTAGSHFLMDIEVIERVTWPILLRPISITSSEQGGLCFNSVDADGRRMSRFEQVDDPLEVRGLSPSGSARIRGKKYDFLVNAFSTSGQFAAGYHPRRDDDGQVIVSKIIAVRPNHGHNYPEFYHQVVIKTNSSPEFDQITIALRIDMNETGKRLAKVGFLRFERFYRAGNVEGRLHLDWPIDLCSNGPEVASRHIDKDHWLDLTACNRSIGHSEYCTGRRDSFLESSSLIVGRAAADYANIQSNFNRPDLNQIAGWHILTDPPRSLIDLFLDQPTE